jgi:hypothetical protein
MGTPTAWRLERRDARGTAYTPAYFTIANIVETLDRFEVDANGSCRDGSFKAFPNNVYSAPLDIWTLQGSDNGTFSDVVNYYAGELHLFPGVKLAETGGHELVGLKDRLKTASPPKDFYAGGDIGTVFQNVASDVITNGNLGSALLYNSSLIPTQSASIGGVTNAGGSVHDLLDSISKTKNTLVWGVNADRNPFQKMPSGSVSLTEGTNVEVNWKLIDASQIINQIDWIVPIPNSDRVLRYSSKDVTSQARYGTRFVNANVPPELGILTQVIGTASGSAVGGAGGGLTASSGIEQGALDGAVNPARAVDQNLHTYYQTDSLDTIPPSGTATVTVSAILTTPTGANFLVFNVLSAGSFGAGSTADTHKLEVISGSITNLIPITTTLPDGTHPTGLGFDRLQLARSIDPTATVHKVSYTRTTTNTSGAGSFFAPVRLRTFEIQAYSLNTTLLDTIAQNLYRAAPLDPATIRVTGQWVSPVPSVTITTLAYGALTRVAKVFRYGVSKEDGFWTEIELEQEYDAQKSLDAALENQKDNAAKMNAARFATKVVR